MPSALRAGPRGHRSPCSPTGPGVGCVCQDPLRALPPGAACLSGTRVLAVPSADEVWIRTPGPMRLVPAEPQPSAQPDPPHPAVGWGVLTPAGCWPWVESLPSVCAVAGQSHPVSVWGPEAQATHQEPPTGKSTAPSLAGRHTGPAVLTLPQPLRSALPVTLRSALGLPQPGVLPHQRNKDSTPECPSLGLLSPSLRLSPHPQPLCSGLPPRHLGCC